MFQRWPKRDPNKHYYLVPNEVFNLGLSSHEIAVYNYLLRCEDRRTYQCHPSYRTIGRAVQLSENTVRKYVAGLEEKGLIHTEPSNQIDISTNLISACGEAEQTNVFRIKAKIGSVIPQITHCPLNIKLRNGIFIRVGAIMKHKSADTCLVICTQYSGHCHLN